MLFTDHHHPAPVVLTPGRRFLFDGAVRDVMTTPGYHTREALAATFLWTMHLEGQVGAEDNEISLTGREQRSGRLVLQTYVAQHPAEAPAYFAAFDGDLLAPEDPTVIEKAAAKVYHLPVTAVYQLGHLAHHAA